MLNKGNRATPWYNIALCTYIWYIFMHGGMVLHLSYARKVWYIFMHGGNFYTPCKKIFTMGNFRHSSMVKFWWIISSELPTHTSAAIYILRRPKLCPLLKWCRRFYLFLFWPKRKKHGKLPGKVKLHLTN